MIANYIYSTQSFYKDTSACGLPAIPQSMEKGLPIHRQAPSPISNGLASLSGSA